MATDDTPKAKLTVVEGLDEDEIEFQKLRRDLPGVKGASAIGIVSITVSRKPEENEFFRTHPDFMPIIPIVNIEVGMERQFFAVTDNMVVALAGIGITVSDHRLYMIVTPRGAVRIIPINVESDNEYIRSKEIGLIEGTRQWVRLYSDRENRNYKVFPAPLGVSLIRSGRSSSMPRFSELRFATRAAWSTAPITHCSSSGRLVTNLSSVVALPFAEIWAEDFEWVPKLGERHDVVCYGARELRSGRTLRLWRDQLDYRFRESCHKRGIHLSFQAPICAGALRTKD